MGANTILFSSESVAIGHSDKLCDQVSDASLDDVLRQDEGGRVALETSAKNNIFTVFGELTTTGWVDIPRIVRSIVKRAGYNNPDFGLHYESLGVIQNIEGQSPDISQGVTEGEGLHKEQGAGDQGMMFGFAIRETPELMPLPIYLAHELASRLQEVRERKAIPYLRPDGKTQVTVEYDSNGKPLGVHTVVVSAQHNPDVEHGQIVEDIKAQVIMPIIGGQVSSSTIYHINPTGKFVIGGPRGDSGLTGRKIIVDSYGAGHPFGGGRHGGGAFSGKDPSKVDRSGAYAVRYIAKNIVAADLADACEVQVAYAIGVAEPVSVMVNTFGTAKGVTDRELERMVREHFSLKPADIIKHFGLTKPDGWSYLQTATYGHFGRPEFPWERLDKVADLRR